MRLAFWTVVTLGFLAQAGNAETVTTPTQRPTAVPTPVSFNLYPSKRLKPDDALYTDGQTVYRLAPGRKLTEEQQRELGVRPLGSSWDVGTGEKATPKSQDDRK